MKTNCFLMFLAVSLALLASEFRQHTDLEKEIQGAWLAAEHYVAQPPADLQQSIKAMTFATSNLVEWDSVRDGKMLHAQGRYGIHSFPDDEKKNSRLLPTLTVAPTNYPDAVISSERLLFLSDVELDFDSRFPQRYGKLLKAKAQDGKRVLFIRKDATVSGKPVAMDAQEKDRTKLFANVDDALSVLTDRKSELRWEASNFLKEHPAEAIPKLKRLIEGKNSSYFIVMCTLTDIGGESVVRFYADLLDRNRYDVDEDGKPKIYGLGSRRGCMKPHYSYGEAIVKQIGKLGNPLADDCLRRAWSDSDEAVRRQVPKARYDIGALTLKDLEKLARTDQANREIYCDALLAIGEDNIHEKTSFAIEIFEMLCGLPEAGNLLHASARLWLMQCYELKGDFKKALAHCDWVIENSENKDFSSRCKERRLELLFCQGELTMDDLFRLAKRENELYERIAQLGRSWRYDSLRIFDRIIKEAPSTSAYADEAQYWKLEYYDHCGTPELARSQAEFILKNCKQDHVLEWVRQRMAKQKEVADRTVPEKVR